MYINGPLLKGVEQQSVLLSTDQMRPFIWQRYARLLLGYYCCSAAKTVWLMAAAFAGTAVAVDGSSC